MTCQVEQVSREGTRKKGVGSTSLNESLPLLSWNVLGQPFIARWRPSRRTPHTAGLVLLQGPFKSLSMVWILTVSRNTESVLTIDQILIKYGQRQDYKISHIYTVFSPLFCSYGQFLNLLKFFATPIVFWLQCVCCNLKAQQVQFEVF